MRINDLFDAFIKKRQAKCAHPYQDRVHAPKGIFCGLCGKQEK